MGKVRIAHNGGVATEAIANIINKKWDISTSQYRLSLFDWNLKDFRQMN